MDSWDKHLVVRQCVLSFQHGDGNALLDQISVHPPCTSQAWELGPCLSVPCPLVALPSVPGEKEQTGLASFPWIAPRNTLATLAWILVHSGPGEEGKKGLRVCDCQTAAFKWLHSLNTLTPFWTAVSASLYAKQQTLHEGPRPSGHPSSHKDKKKAPAWEWCFHLVFHNTPRKEST